MEMRLPVIRGRPSGPGKTVRLFTDQIESDSRIPGKLDVFGRSSKLERHFGACLRTILEWVLATSEYFSQGVDHPCFYGVLKTCPSYRNVKRKLYSFHQYRNFARTYTCPSGRVKFSRVRAAFYWNFCQPPEQDDYFIKNW